MLSCSAELSMSVRRVPPPHQPGRYVRRPAAELDDVHSDIFREGSELGLRNAEDAPGLGVLWAREFAEIDRTALTL